MEISTSKSVAEREDEGTVVHVRDANGEKQFYGEGDAGKPVTITVAGSYSSRFRRASEEQRERMLKQRRSTVSGEGLYRQQLALTAACIIGWEGFTSNGAPFPFTKENAIALLDAAPWIRADVEEAMNDHASFFPQPLGVAP